MSAKEIQQQFLTLRGIRIHYLACGGAGSPVLLLHGTGVDSASLSWGDVMRPLAESGHRVVAPDLPGYGDSDRPDIDYSFPFYIDFVDALIDALGLKSPSLAGLSMGGGLVLGLALRRPERFHRLVLVDSYGFQRRVRMQFLSWLTVKIPGVMESSWAMMIPSRSMTRWGLASLFHDPKAISETLMDEVMAETRKPHPVRAWARIARNDIFLRGLRTVYLDRLGEISNPVLILHGDDDKSVPLACAEEAHRRMPGSTLRVIAGAGHWLQREKPQEFLRLVADFLKD